MSSRGESQDALVITAPAELSGRAFSLEAQHLTIGRAEDNDVRLEDPFVSRRHAVLHRAGRSLVIEDAGSRGGVTVNGVAVGEPAFLKDGDLIGIGKVQLRVAKGHSGADGGFDVTMAGAKVAARSAPSVTIGEAALPSPPAVPTFALDRQAAGAISNVAGNQYNIEALRVLGPMRQRARWVLRVGLALFILGFIAGAVGEVMWRSNVTSCFSATAGPNCGDNTTGLAVAQFGGILLGLGVIVLVISLFMRREVKKKEARL